jgi:UTP--glucose-1-phosphate uridylyltransferase
LNHQVTKAIIPAAGLGTRMLPAAKSVPKEMINIVDKPAIHYIVEEIVASGITDILIVTARGKATMEDYFDCSYELEDKLCRSKKEELLEQMREISQMASITYVRQREPKGLGHAILCGKAFAGDEPVAVLLGDDLMYTDREPVTQQLCAAYEAIGQSILGVQKVLPEHISKYGNIKVGSVQNNIMQVLDMVEKPRPEEAFSSYAAMGRYVVTKAVFDKLENIGAGVGGEIQLTDALRMVAQEKALWACDFHGRRYDTGDKLGYLEAVVEYGLRNSQIGPSFREYLKNLDQIL